MSLAAEVGEFESERRPIEVELEAMSERPARLAQCPGDARDGQVWGVVEVLRGQVDDRPILDDSARVDRPRDAANQADEMRVVDVQIDGRTAAPLRDRRSRWTSRAWRSRASDGPPASGP